MSDTDIAYYRGIDILKRIEQERIIKKISVTKFSKLLGNCYAYWSVKYASANIPRVQTLKKMAKILDVNIYYLIYGYEYGPYKEYDIDLKRIPEYTAGHNYFINGSQKSTISRIKHGKQIDIGMQMFFAIEEKIQKNLFKIITKSC